MENEFREVVKKLEVEPSDELTRKQTEVMIELKNLGVTEEQMCNLIATTMILALRLQ